MKLPEYKPEELIKEVYSDYKYKNLSISEKVIYDNCDKTPEEILQLYINFLKVGQSGIRISHQGKRWGFKLLNIPQKNKLQTEIERLS